MEREKRGFLHPTMSSSDAAASGSVIIILLLLVLLRILRVVNYRQDRRRVVYHYHQTTHRYEDGTEMTDICDEIPSDAEGFTLEEFQDDHNKTFEYFGPWEDNPTAQRLRDFCNDGDIESIRNFFRDLYQTEQNLSTKKNTTKRAFYIAAAIEVFSKKWSAHDPRSSAIFCEVLDKWNKLYPKDVDCLLLRTELNMVWA